MASEITSTSATSTVPDAAVSKANENSILTLSHISESIQTTTQYAGPFPPPSFLAEYEKNVPGLGKLIFENTFEESKHRREMEKVLTHALTESIAKTIPRGQHYALATVILVIALAGVLAYLHYPAAATIIVGLDLAIMVGAFLRSPSLSGSLLRQSIDRKNPEEKKKLLEAVS